MPITIGKKKIKGRLYYYARECKRVDGKPRIVWQKYLGKADRIVEAIDGLSRPPTPAEVVVSEFGAVAALFDVASRLRLVQTVDAHVRKREQGLSVGHYMLVAAINRCVCPTSKAKIGDWFESTPLRRLAPAKKSQLSSKRFWDNMGHLDAQAIRDIERDLTERIVTEFGVDTRCLLFDATNFFTFIDSFNDAPTLAQRGNSKEKRNNLRIVGLALLVSVDFHIPLFHDTYPGNRNDTKEFEAITDRLIERHQVLAKSVDDITLVFDKGNNSADNIAALDEGPYHFVGSLKLNQCPDLLEVPLEKYEPLLHPKLYGVRAHRVTREALGRERTVIITYNEQLFLTQTQSLLAEVRKRCRNLNAFGRQLCRRQVGEVTKGRKPTVESVRKRAQALLKGQYVADVIELEVVESDGVPDLRYRVDHDALQRIFDERFGKTVLFTDNDSWSDVEVVLAYRGQAGIEGCFKTMKNPHFVSWSPMFHWTDDKIRVHAFYCVVALMLVSLLQRELHHAGIDLTIPALVEALSAIREVAITYASKGRAREPQLTLSKLTDEQKRLFDTLRLDRYLEVR
ncbi:MAG TPA: IS1634 family transposase [Myxococcota bacterium]|jgi:transposase|nr:IS1634 family transposase [Myxococcota bacterium]